jgi:hypothetical protein
VFPVGVVMLSIGYALAYWGVNTLKWVHDSAHPKMQPPGLPFLLGISSAPSGKPFAAPVNTEGADNPYEPFGAATAASAGGAAPAVGAPPAAGPAGSQVA